MPGSVCGAWDVVVLAHPANRAVASMMGEILLVIMVSKNKGRRWLV
jgi:hypothetical protein